jgi:PS-10 peptidase S37
MPTTKRDLRRTLETMHRLLVALAICTGCGGDDPNPAPGGIADQLAALPGVTVEARATATPGYEFFVLSFEQPVDHEAGGGPTFRQRVALLHKSTALPMVALTSGYWDYYGDLRYELTGLLGANQISIEHRYFGDSRPANPDWTKLTIEQMANDEHVILEKLRTVYDGAFVTTGGSKGGMTAIYHRRFFPDDVEATVPYVAPISFGAPDARYVPFLDTLGPPACREAVRAAATELLQNRRAAMIARAETQAAAEGIRYTRVLIGPAVEGSITSVEWAYWQYLGVSYCPMVPAVTASDDDFWDFLEDASAVSDNADDRIAQFEAYYYQAYAQLGFPDSIPAYLKPFLLYTDRDYDASLPTALPAYDEGVAMNDIASWVKTEGAQLLFVYGQWDPWTGGKFDLGAATDSALFVQAQGTHGSRIARLAAADRSAAFAKLEAWTGVAPVLPAIAFSSAPREPRVPPAMLRALRR